MVAMKAVPLAVQMVDMTVVSTVDVTVGKLVVL